MQIHYCSPRCKFTKRTDIEASEVSCYFEKIKYQFNLLFEEIERYINYVMKIRYADTLENDLEGIVDKMNYYAIWIEVVSDWISFTDAQKKSTKRIDNVSYEQVQYKERRSYTSRWLFFCKMKARYMDRTFSWIWYTIKLSSFPCCYDKQIVDWALKGNWTLWNYTSDPELRKRLEETNDFIRKKVLNKSKILLQLLFISI